MARRVKAKHGFTAWAVLVYAFLYLPILVMVIFAFNKPSAPALAAFHGSNICSIPPAQIGNITVWNGFTSCWFSAGLHDPTYLPAIVVSLQIAALAQLPAALRDDPMFNVPKSYTNNYHYILNVSPQVVETRTQIYSEFKAA